MIKFFRKIRQNLIMENKTSKYLKYAIGEIVLVVIGILIALQINTWNNQIESNKRIKLVLKTIKEDLVKDSIRVLETLNNATIEANHNQKLMTRVYHENATVDTLIHIAKYEFSYFWLTHFEYTTANFESIKSSGFIEKIPDSIKSNLVSLYNSQENWINITNGLNLQYREHFDEFVRHYSPDIKHIGEKKNYNSINQITWQKIDSNHFIPRFLILIAAKDVLFGNYKQELEENKLKLRHSINLIDTYLHD